MEGFPLDTAAGSRYAPALLAGMQEDDQVVRKRDLHCGRRRRGRVISGWLGNVRIDHVYNRRTGHRVVAWAVLEFRHGYRRAVIVERFPMPKRPEQDQPGVGTVRKAGGVCRWLDKTPLLASYLQDLDYEDGGGPRELSYLTIRPSRFGWDVTLKDPSTAKQLRTSVTDLTTALASIEALLASGTCPWEDDRWAQERLPKKKK